MPPAPQNPIAYAFLTPHVFDDGHATLYAYGCIIGPDGTLQSMAGSYQFTVEIPLAYGMNAADLQARIGQAIADSYGGSAPDVALPPAF